MTRIAAGALALLMAVLALGGLLAGGVQGAPTADGDLDPTFGTGGLAPLRLAQPVDGAGYRPARQADGKLVLAGSVNSGPNTFGVVRLNADGSLDPTFGLAGQTLIVFDETGLYPYQYLTLSGLAIQADGKILVVGSGEGPNSYRDWTLARLNPDGTLDPTFGTGGRVRTDFGASSDDVAGEVALQSDGKIVVTGTTRPTSGNGLLALARYTANGSLDPTFDGDGLVTTAWGNYAVGTALLIQPDGRIVAGGTVQQAGNSDFALARYLANGSLDPSFGTGGLVATDFGATDQVFSLALNGTGAISALGETRTPPTSSDVALARYLANGTPDPAFGTGGRVTTDLGGDDSGYGLAVLTDGRLLAVGHAGYSQDFDLGLVRYLPNGSPDPTFGTGGVVITDLGGNDVARGVLLNADGSALVGGSSRIPGVTQPFVARYTGGGTLDPTFGPGGVVRQSVLWSNAISRGVVRQPDGKVVVVGNTNSSRPVLVRFTAGGQPDSTFGVSGVVTPTLTGYTLYLYAVTLQPDGKIVAAGQRRDSVEGDTLVVRLLPDGTPDATFGNGGYATIDINFSSNDYASAVVVQPDGKLVTAGNANGLGYVAARFLPNGQPDATFNSIGWNYIAGFTSEATDLALQADGKVVLVGYMSGSGGPARFGVGRFLANGQRDTAFGTNGLVTVAFPSPYDIGNATTVALTADGRIVAAGSLQSSGGGAAGLVQLLPDGTPDPTFGTGGVAVAVIGWGGANALVLDGAGRLLVSGGGVLARFLPDGTLDPGFGTGGSLTPPAALLALADPADGTLVAAGVLHSNGDRLLTAVRFLYDTGPPPTPTGSVTPLPTATPVIPSATPTPPCGGSWTSVPVPTASTGSHVLVAIAARTSNDIWAVGRYIDATVNSASLITHWNGSAWSVVPSPNRFGSTFLNGVAVVSANDAWAVGYDTLGTLTMHWNGTIWQIVASPNGTSSSELYGVTALAANNVWAVGSTSASSNTVQTLVLHWDGATWSRVSSPNSPLVNNWLYAVTAIGPNDLWAVGTAAPSPDTHYDSLTLHWNGSAWNVVSSPNGATTFNTLYGVAGVAANDVWAVGPTQALHWDGSAWADVPRPEGHWNSITALSAGDAWTVGSIWNVALQRTEAVTAHWNGTGWVNVPDPAEPGNTELSGVAAITTNEVWAVGDTASSGSPSRPYSLRWSAACATATVTPTHTAGPSPTRTSSPSPTATSPSQGTVSPTPSPTRTSGPAPSATASGQGTVSATPSLTRTSGPAPSATATSARTASPGPSPTALTCPVQFTDVPAGSTFYDYVRCLACRGIVGGYPCGGPGEPCPGPYFRPGTNVTRGQVSKIVAEAAGFSDPVPSTQQTFQDVPPGSTFALWVERLAARGILGGYPCGGPFEPCIAPTNRPYFRPNNNVTRGQLAKIVASAAQYTETPTGQTFEDVSPASTFYLYIERLSSRGIIGGYSCGGAGAPCVAPTNRPYFRPNTPATRGQMSKIAAVAFFPNCTTPARR